MLSRFDVIADATGANTIGRFMLENPIVPKDGHVAATKRPGFGMEIKPEVWKHPAAVVQTTTA